MTTKRSLIPSCVFLLFLLLLPLRAQENSKNALADFVHTQEGALPILLSAPHGGVGVIPGVPERKGEGLKKGPSGFVTGRDTNTDLLALEIAALLEARTGKKPYYVIAKFSRKYIDANRPADIAYEHPKAKPVYDHYHQLLDRYCAQVQKRYGKGLLLDVHGQGSANDTIFRGTKDGKTVKLLIERHGPSAQVGPRSFFGLLAKEGCKVFPTDDSQERAGFTGGFIVQHHGSHQGHGIDAIQLEFGGDYRAKGKLKDTAAKVVGAIEAFAKIYLPEK